jgi:hypothetical protein
MLRRIFGSKKQKCENCMRYLIQFAIHCLFHADLIEENKTGRISSVCGGDDTLAVNEV